MSFFEARLLKEYPSLMTGESTPSYLLHGDVVPDRILRLIGPQVKLIVTMRDPVARAYSQYQMVIDPSGSEEQKRSRGDRYVGMTFEQAVEADLAELQLHGVVLGWKEGFGVMNEDKYVEVGAGSHIGEAGMTEASSPSSITDTSSSPKTPLPVLSYSSTVDGPHLPSFADLSRSFLPSRPMGTGGHSLLARSMYACLLPPWFEKFPRENLKIMFMDDMVARGMSGLMDDVYAHVGLPPHDVEDDGAKNTRAYGGLSEKTRKRLERFFAPYNDLLRDMLGEEKVPKAWSTLRTVA